MDNQHRKIRGYRELTQDEVNLMNEVKSLGPQMEAIISKVLSHVNDQYNNGDEDEIERLEDANPSHWVLSASQKFQEGLMALVRAVAQPDTF